MIQEPSSFLKRGNKLQSIWLSTLRFDSIPTQSIRTTVWGTLRLAWVSGFSFSRGEEKEATGKEKPDTRVFIAVFHLLLAWQAWVYALANQNYFRLSCLLCINFACKMTTAAVFGCLPFTQKIRKFRMECKWKDEFCLPERKFSQENGISWKVVQNSQTEFPNGKCANHLPFETSSRPYAIFYLRHVMRQHGCCRDLCFPVCKNFEGGFGRKMAPQPHKNQQFSSDLSSWKLQWLILSGILHLPHNREAARSNSSSIEASIISLNTTISAAILKMSKSP